MYIYSTGFIVGRFQPMHRGHEFMIMKGLSVCRRLLVVIGSADKHGTPRNPFSYEQRKRWIKQCCPFIDVIPIDDLHEDPVDGGEWGDYLLETVEHHLGYIPQLYISGMEVAGRTNWFNGIERAKNIEQLMIPRRYNCSSSKVRDYLLNGEYGEWRSSMPYMLSNTSVYEEQRKTIMRIL